MARAYRNPFVQYFVDVWSGVVTTYLGMRLTLGYFFRKPVTMRYPEVRPKIPEGHRGLHELHEGQCMVCKGCASACPVDCITIESVGRGRDAMLTRFEIDYSKCLFCELCTEPCANHCLVMGPKYDLSSTSRQSVVVSLIRPKSAEEIQAHLEMLERKEAEKKAKIEAARRQQAEQEAKGESPKKEGGDA